MPSFASEVTKTIDVPNDPPHTAVIQMVEWELLHEAEHKKSVDTLREMREQFGDALIGEQIRLSSEGKRTVESVPAPAKDPLDRFDLGLLLKHGVKSWTFKDIPVNAKTLSGLFRETARHFGREILRLSDPTLFPDYDASAAQKNGSASSGAA